MASSLSQDTSKSIKLKRYNNHSLVRTHPRLPLHLQLPFPRRHRCNPLPRPCPCPLPLLPLLCVQCLGEVGLPLCHPQLPQQSHRPGDDRGGLCGYKNWRCNK
ncbi:hypothetical protein GLYMA_04G103966v4 [Glycine max]|nr:hypothetical protein GLYMA_04G103966v4 [Glycine max]KAH1110788.1 hypothetical protein GYH30_009550 [Glycine max]